VVKRRFKVLVVAQEYSPEMQSRLISGLAVLHNFIRAHDPTDIPDDTEMETEEETARAERRTAKLAERAVGNEERNRAAERREAIAVAMWADYRHRRQRRARHL
jgi:hypothetical protein